MQRETLIILPADYPLAHRIKRLGLLNRQMVEVRLPDLTGLPAVLATYALDCAFTQRKGQEFYERLTEWEPWQKWAYCKINPTWLIALWRHDNGFDQRDFERDLDKYSNTYADVTSEIFKSIARDIDWQTLEWLNN